VRLDADGCCESVALALINAGPAPSLVSGVAAALVGESPSDDRIANAATVAANECRPVTDMHGSEAYRRHLVRVLATRTLTTAAERAAQGGSGPS
jgi:carbon-monoxide dehydrogenase medium subunit